MASGSDRDSVPGSVGPEDLISQILGSKVSPWDKSSFFKELAAFLGFQEGSKYVSFPDMVFAMVSKEVEGSCPLALGSRCGAVRYQTPSRPLRKAECEVTPS
ncbi:hypothetical protein E2C01_067446 [Portunus trituberculatus]|uniref:Uncharacterized protein n=1 Tax=Portunus trituberculatus TaxID=210409 RepID=A0A5B7HWQ6_PORTR|nr:hypothetical protein [Portunus trituberculatus]